MSGICSTTGKTKYDTEKSAQSGLEKMKKHRPDYAGEPYFCLYCSSYHFGRREKSKKD